MGRPRKTGNKDMGSGLYRDKAGRFYIKHPLTGKQVSLKTKDAARARKLFNMMRASWENEVEAHQAEQMVAKLSMTGGERSPTVAAYAADWRVRRIPKLLKKNGKPLAAGTKKGYDGLIRRDVEAWPAFADTRMTDTDEVQLRRFLKPWIDKPHMYNYMLAALSRMFRDAVDEGVIRRSPMREIDRRGTPKRELYITDAQYVSIIDQVEAGAGYADDIEHEWIARAVDLIYLVSHNPQDVLSIRESDITSYNKPEHEAGTGEALHGEVLIERGKTEQAVLIYCNEDLWELIEWLRAWKRRQRLMSDYLICYPLKATKRRLIGTKVSVEYVSRRFTAAARAAGHDGMTLRDLRPKGLSDEFVIGGDSDKGGHKTDAMKQHYRRIKLPMKARSNLRRLRKNG